MIGPGTGIAPFRPFLQERQATKATGRPWRFFGDRRCATDFLYGDELAAFKESGTLTRLDLAFSRDRTDGSKEYVQHRMWEQADKHFGWLSDGAHVYVCGDERRMARTSTDFARHRGSLRSVGRCSGSRVRQQSHQVTPLPTRRLLGTSPLEGFWCFVERAFGFDPRGVFRGTGAPTSRHHRTPIFGGGRRWGRRRKIGGRRIPPRKDQPATGFRGVRPAADV
jgi:hypothetical protein